MMNRMYTRDTETVYDGCDDTDVFSLLTDSLSDWYELWIDMSSTSTVSDLSLNWPWLPVHALFMRDEVHQSSKSEMKK